MTSLLLDVLFSLLLTAVVLIVFVRLVHDYRLVYTIGNLCKKIYKIEYKPDIVIPLNLYELCRNVDIVEAYCPQAMSTRLNGDVIEVRGLTPDLIRGQVDLDVKLRVYGLVDVYEFRRRIRLVLH